MFSSSAAHWAEKPAKFRSTVKISPHAIARRRSVLLYSVLILRIIDLSSLKFASFHKISFNFLYKIWAENLRFILFAKLNFRYTI